MWIDTHCHLDAPEFAADREAVIASAQRAGVSAFVIPAVTLDTCQDVLTLCQQQPACVPALGLHPIYADSHHQLSDIDRLDELLARHRPRAVGEIGLDFFVEGLSEEKQTALFVAQLKLARKHDLPVLLHVRRSQDKILKYLRQFPVRGGFAHAFNGSRQQAQQFLDMGFKLGFGGAMTYPRALRIRELATTLPLDALVIETDAPDIPPEWQPHQRHAPDQLPRIASLLAELRGGIPLGELATQLRRNSEAVLGPLPAGI